MIAIAVIVFILFIYFSSCWTQDTKGMFQLLESVDLTPIEEEDDEEDDEEEE